MGISGSGLATTLSSILMFVGLAVVVSVERGFRRYHLFGRFWRADWPRFRGLMRLGLPIAGILTFEVTIFNAAALLMGLIGAASLAAHAIAIQIASISFMVPMGISQACTVRVGRAYGAGDPIGITRAGWTAFVLGVSFMALMALTMVLWPRTLIGGFIDVSRPRQCRSRRRSPSPFLPLPACSRSSTARRRWPAACCADCTTRRCRWSTRRSAIGASACRSAWCWRSSSALHGAGIWIGLSTGLAVVAVLLLARWLRRDRHGLVLAPA